MGWTDSPGQAGQSVATYCYNPDLSSYYQSNYQPTPATSTTPSLECAGGHALNGYYHMPNYQEGPQPFQYPCVPQSQPQAQMPLSTMQNPQSSYLHFGDYQLPTSGSSNRLQRNMAEKMRRDKLNSYINDLAALVPMVSNSSKRMDKTSVLRLSATFLRQYQLVSATKSRQPSLPQALNSVDWFELLLEEINGVMLIVTSIGKIVFISENIEKILGHTQLELFGQSLFNITCPEDHAELKKCLTPDDMEEFSSDGDLDSDEVAASSSESISGRLCTSRNSTNKSTRTTSSSQPSSSSAPDDTDEIQRRSFYLRLRQRCLARSEQPQYELVHVMGVLRIPKKLASQVHKKSRKHKDITNTNSNEIRLVAVLKPFRERRVTEVSLMEATRDEYITRHLIDGRIIYSDHRISVVSGYLFEEVSGLPAFQFMHKDDVRWVLIALRQMFWRGESYGSSCYRLKSKNGEFIYLKTHGYLELSANTETFASFICVNTMVSPEEGKREIRLMRQRFSALIESKVEPGIVAIAKDHCFDEPETEPGGLLPDTEDPVELNKAIRAMTSNIPALGSMHEDPQKSRETPFAKAKLMSKALPPVSQANSSTVVTVSQDKSPKPATVMLSPQPLSVASASPSSQPSTPTSRTPTSPNTSSSQAMQNRPSVLRLASRQPITVYNEANENASDERYHASPLDDCKQGIVKEEFIKQESPDPDDFESTQRAGVVRHSEPAAEDNGRVGVLVKAPLKRQFDFEETQYTSVPSKKMVAETSTSGQQIACRGLSKSQIASSTTVPCGRNLATAYQLKCSTEVKNSMTPTSTEDFTQLVSLDECGSDFQFDGIESYDNKPEPVQMLNLLGVNEDLRHNHIELESRMQLQGAQINAIEGDLDAVSHTSERFCLENNLGKLRAEHSKHKEMLKTLTKDHLSLQFCKPNNVANIHNGV